jgi:hypothetical protein
MYAFKSRWLIVAALVFCLSAVYAQTLTPDSAAYSAAAGKAVDFFNTAIAEQSEIYNGRVYEFLPKATKGSVYLDDKNYCIPGLIRYNGTVYKNVPVLYDAFSDEMVAFSPGSVYFILQPEKLSDVYFSGHHFIYVDAANGGDIKPGYYDELYDGKTTVLAKLMKVPHSSVNQTGVEIVYTEETNIYLKKNGKYIQVDSKGDVMSILKERKKELNQYLSSSKIKFNKDKQGSVARLARYYDQITN